MKILVLDDHGAIRLFVKQQILEIVPTAEIILCGTIESALDRFQQFDSIHFVICDLELNVGNNIKIPEFAFQHKIPFMVYSSHVNKVLISELMNYQINCYVSKTSSIEALKEGLISLFTGKQYFCPLVVSTIESKEKFKETEKLVLTSGQKIVLEVLAKGFNREEAAKMLEIKLTTLNNHIARAREMNDCENFEELLRRYRFWDLL